MLVFALLAPPNAALAQPEPAPVVTAEAPTDDGEGGGTVAGEPSAALKSGDQLGPAGPVGLRNEDRRLAAKLRRAELLVGSVQVATMGALTLMPESFSKWSGRPWSQPGRSLKRAWTSPPRLDQDSWYVNYLGHPYAGGLYYNAVRSQGMGRKGAFAYAVVQSTVYEYLIEATVERPSVQDLLATPIVGAALGELSHRLTITMGRNGFSPVERVVTAVLNPMFVINNGFKPARLR